MDENIKKNIFYRPDLEIEKNYYSEGRFEKESPVAGREEIHLLTSIEEIVKRNAEAAELLLSVYKVISFLPDQLRQTVEDIVTELVFLITDPEFNEKLLDDEVQDSNKSVTEEENEEHKQDDYDWFSSYSNESIVDEDGFVWGEPEGSGIVVEIEKMKSNCELVDEQYKNDVSLIVENYAKNLAHVMQRYLCNLSIAMNETGLDKVEYLNYDYEGESVSGITENMWHMSDTIARNQLMIDELARLFAKTHSAKNTENIIAALDITAQERIRYYKEEYSLELTSPLALTNRELLRKCRQEYDNKYFAAKLDLHKYLDSGIKITEDILDKAKDMQQAKAGLLLEGVNVFTHKKYEEVQVGNSLSAEYGSLSNDYGSASVSGAVKATSITGASPSSDPNPDYKNLHATGSNVVDKMRSLQGKITYHASDGTNCMRTIGIAYEGTDMYGQINCETALNVAKSSNQFVVCDSNGYAADGKKYDVTKAGTIAMVNGDGHAVMITEKGGVIQNGSSHNGVWESSLSVQQVHGSVNHYIVYVGSGGAGK